MSLTPSDKIYLQKENQILIIIGLVNMFYVFFASSLFHLMNDYDERTSNFTLWLDLISIVTIIFA